MGFKPFNNYQTVFSFKLFWLIFGSKNRKILPSVLIDGTKENKQKRL